MEKIKRFLKEEEGVTAIEYGLIASWHWYYSWRYSISGVNSTVCYFISTVKTQ